ncbi:MAG: hypothetical protein HOU81_02965 [Hamadaea sp.]|nr:hypothetical protein [Hamadaea sp.]NUT04813.1 hypothetical protein [Hamadaea sp.]
MGIFGRLLGGSPKPDHDPGVVYVFDARQQLGYYSVVCRCGWYAEPVDVAYPDAQAEQQMANAAIVHSPDADTEVAFPLDTPPGVR